MPSRARATSCCAGRKRALRRSAAVGSDGFGRVALIALLRLARASALLLGALAQAGQEFLVVVRIRRHPTVGTAELAEARSRLRVACRRSGPGRVPRPAQDE